MSTTLKDRWRATLKARYMIDETDERSRECLDEWVGTLEGIYKDFIRKDARGQSISDPSFEDKIHNGTGRQYEQCLAEMLFFDRLRRERFNLTPVGGAGPDFKASKNGVTVWFEVVTPEPDRDGEIERDLADVSSRLHPSAGHSDAFRRELLFRITSSLDTKLKKLRGDVEKGNMNPSEPCVIVLNDSLLCPPDLYMFGVTHGAEAAYDSYWPLIAHATMAKGYSYRYPLPHPTESLWARAEPSDVLNKLNGSRAPINMAMFEDPTNAHVSAVLQITLREDYAYARQLERLAWAKAMTPVGGNMIEELHRGVLVRNPVATVTLPQLMWTKVWERRKDEPMREPW
ncbi:hypothetical protein [Burkholderia ubonensis]|uniref:hypothetical protein n=1 Tax=Burkholderia ubonensis TaxID=101571 RepID=UPI000A79797E|nr:hypothetical protein [Burkholderia ubonensis]